MRFGEINRIIQKDGLEQRTVSKYRDYDEYQNYTEYHQRVQIMRVTDFDTIVQEMHIEHALNDHGAYLEHGKNGKMYVVKYWKETKTDE